MVLLFARQMAPQQELSKSFGQLARQPRSAEGPEEVAVIVIDKGDWSGRLPPDCSTAVRKLVARICA